MMMVVLVQWYSRIEIPEYNPGSELNLFSLNNESRRIDRNNNQTKGE
jgi:hypothetical protein